MASPNPANQAVIQNVASVDEAVKAMRKPMRITASVLPIAALAAPGLCS